MTRGIIEGYENPDGTQSFRPHQPVTIAEFAKMLCLTLGLPWDDALPRTLSAQNNHWAYGYISRLELKGATLFQDPLIDIERSMKTDDLKMIPRDFRPLQKDLTPESITRSEAALLLYPMIQFSHD